MGWIESIYKKAFPSLISIEENTEKITQKQGVDFYLYIKAPKPIKLEVKDRYYDYPDILLEDYSCWERRTPGWARDMSKVTDYLSYIVHPRKEIFMFYYLALRRYFLSEYDRLFDCYVKHSKTGTYIWGKTLDREREILYKTANIPVPLSDFPRGWLLKNCWRYRA